MQISPINICNYSNKKNSRVTFGAIHPCLYFEKVGENSFKLITDNDLIKNTLQKNIVTWLNRNYNTRQKMVRCSSVKPKLETNITKQLRERITRFFINHDEDYRVFGQDKASSYFHYNETSGLLRPYIFTGKSADILQEQADKIKKVKKEIKKVAGELCSKYGFESSAAKVRAIKELEPNLLSAKTAYHDAALNVLYSSNAKIDPKNTLFCAYFEPVTKGKKTTYKLINAEFEKRLL